MRIDRLELKNFKCFRELNISFDPKVNLFVGTNGSGKTALLNGVCASLGAIFQSKGFEEWRNIEDSELRNNGVNTDPLSITTVTAYSDGNNWSRERALVRGRTTTKHAKWASNYGEALLRAFTNKDDKTIAPLIVNYSTQRLFNHGNLAKNQRFEVKRGRRNGYTLCLDNKSMIPTLTDWFKREERDARAMEQSGIPNPGYTLKNTKSAIAEMIRFFEAIHTEHPVHIFYSELDEDIILYIGGMDKLPLKHYSDGYRNLIYLVMDMTYRASQLNPWLDLKGLREQTTGVVMIDEIDLHIHPKWQADIIAFLHQLFPGVQYFITTHSPIVVSNFHPEFGSLYKIGYNQEPENLNERVVDKVTKHFFGKEVNDLLYDLMGASFRHRDTQEKLDMLFLMIDNEANEEEYIELLNILTDRLGADDKDIERAHSLIAWNAYRKANPDAVH
jgi:predicted ATP-binding protein involved in virulence